MGISNLLFVKNIDNVKNVVNILSWIKEGDDYGECGFEKYCWKGHFFKRRE